MLSHKSLLVIDLFVRVVSNEVWKIPAIHLKASHVGTRKVERRIVDDRDVRAGPATACWKKTGHNEKRPHDEKKFHHFREPVLTLAGQKSKGFTFRATTKIEPDWFLSVVRPCRTDALDFE